MPVSLGYIGEGGAFALASLMIGWFGAISLAANQIVTSIGMVLYMIPLGLATAASVCVGQAIGADDIQRVRKIGFNAIALVTVWMGFVTLTLIIIGDDIATALASEPEVAVLATTLFLIIAALQIGDGIQATSLGALRGMLDTKYPVIITLVLFWFISLPAAYVLSVSFKMGAIGVWAGYACGVFCAALILTIRFALKTKNGMPRLGRISHE